MQVCTSSHTLLIYLTPPETFTGGATRFFLSGKYDQVHYIILAILVSIDILKGCHNYNLGLLFPLSFRTLWT